MECYRRGHRVSIRRVAAEDSVSRMNDHAQTTQERLPRNMARLTHVLSVLALASVATACSDPTGPSGNGDGPERMRDVLQTPSFSVNIQEIIVRNGCTDSGCHGIGQAGLWLGPDPDVNYANLVNVTAQSERQFLRIEPFDPTNSYVVIKLEGRQQVGGEMPPGLPLDSIDLTNIRNWVTTGAPNN